MKQTRNAIRNVALVFACGLALTACGKKDEPSTPSTPPASQPAPTPQASAPAAASTAAATPAGVTVVAVDLGNAVDASQKVGTPAMTFSPKDTIYASVSTAGAGSNATVGAKWTYQDGQTVNESSTAISPTGPAFTAFHISKPDGLPAGDYKVDISLNGSPASSKAFSVK
jgi:hypothetical protein